jgi:sialic acid synthase SpsE
VALGATVIERHFTLSRRLDSPDAPLSLEPGEFRALVQSIREAEQVLRPAPRTGLEPDELAFKQRIRHCLLATADIAAGERVDSANAVLKRGNPGEGIDAWAALGHPDRPATAAHAIAAGRWITLADLNPGDS